MARDFTKNTSNVLTLGINALNALCSGAAVVSCHLRFNADTFDTTTNSDNTLFSIIFNDTFVNGIGMNINAGSALRMYARSVSTDAAQIKTGTTALSTGAWHSVGGVVDFGGDTLTPYVNGVAEGGGGVTFGNATYTLGTTPYVPDAIGGYSEVGTQATTDQFDGRIAEVAVWAGATGLSAGDFAALAAGFSADQIQSQLLVFYMRLLGNNSPERDIISGLSGTIAGTIAKAEHCRVFLPGRQIVVPVRVGITFDAASNSGFQVADNDYTFSRIVGTGSNRFLAVEVAILGTPGTTVTAVTDDNGGTPVAMTRIGVGQSATGAGIVEFWGLVNPVSGTKDIRVQLSGAVTSAALAHSYANVQQTSPYANFNSNSATNVGAADATVDITTVAAGSWRLAACATNDPAITVGAGYTIRNNVSGGASNSGADEDTNAAVSPGTAAATFENVGALFVWVAGGYELRPDTAGSLAYTATASLLMGSETLAATSTFVKPTYSASAALVMGSQALAATTTFTKPTYTAAAALTMGSETLSAVATFVKPTYTAASALAITSMTLAATSTFTKPTYAATAGLVTSQMVLAATTTFVKPSYTASAALSAQPMTLAATAVFATAIYTATAGLTITSMVLSAVATFVAGVTPAPVVAPVGPLLGPGVAARERKKLDKVKSVPVDALDDDMLLMVAALEYYWQ